MSSWKGEHLCGQRLLEMDLTYINEIGSLLSCLLVKECQMALKVVLMLVLVDESTSFLKFSGW